MWGDGNDSLKVVEKLFDFNVVEVVVMYRKNIRSSEHS